jgi:hypothetical protein
MILYILIFFPRILFSFIIYYNLFFGVLLSIYLDWIDYRAILGFKASIDDYNSWDKITDLIIYANFTLYSYIALPNVAFILSLGLLVTRIFGTIIFEITHNRILLVIFPNVIDFFMLILGLLSFLQISLSTNWILLIGGISIIFKLIWEYNMHLKQVGGPGYEDPDAKSWIERI